LLSLDNQQQPIDSHLVLSGLVEFTRLQG
jgi:hypothetical protein